jgi:hypothetical protein
LRDKKNDGEGEFEYDRFWYTVRTSVNATVYPHPE